MSEIRYKDFKNKVDLTKPYEEQSITLQTKFGEAEFNNLKNRQIAETITQEGTIGSGAASAVDLSQDSPEVQELIERIADETKIPGYRFDADDETVDFIKRVQEEKKKGSGISGIFESLPPELKEKFELFDVSKVDKLVEVPGTVDRRGQPLYASLPGRTMTDATLAAGAEAAKNLGLEGLLQGPNPVGGLDQLAREIELLEATRPGRTTIDTLPGSLRDFFVNKQGLSPTREVDVISDDINFTPASARVPNLADLNQDGVVDEVDEQISISSLPAQSFVPGVSSKPMKRKGPAGLAGLGEAVRFALNPIGFLLSKLPGKQYDMTAPLTAGLTSDRILVGPGAAVSGGIYSARNIGGGQTNTPLSMAADFYDPETGKTRFDRAFDRFLKTGRRRDLIGASRSGAGARRLLRQARSGIIQDASGRNVIIPGRSTGVGGRGPGPGGIRETDTGGFGQADFGNRSDDKFGAL